MNKMKPAVRTANVILDAEGNWAESKDGALLAYTSKADALHGLEIHAGARVLLNIDSCSTEILK